MNPVPVYFIFEPFICSIGVNVATESSTWENMVKFVQVWKKFEIFYLVVDKNNFNDNNNKRNEGDHHHCNQDANIIYKSLK